MNNYSCSLYTRLNHAICLYKYAVYCIPYAIYFALASAFGIGVLLLLHRVSIKDRPEVVAVLLLFITIVMFFGTLFCIFLFLSFFVYYIFAGFIVGLWFQLGNLNFSWQILVPEWMGLSVIIVDSLLRCIAGQQQ